MKPTSMKLYKDARMASKVKMDIDGIVFYLDRLTGLEKYKHYLPVAQLLLNTANCKKMLDEYRRQCDIILKAQREEFNES